VGYAVALAGWFLVARLVRWLWPARTEATFDRPWLEFGIAVVGGLAVLGVGQLWSAGFRVPDTGPLGPLGGAVNQLLIFAPLVLVPVYRRQSWRTAWLAGRHMGFRIGVGVALAGLALTAYAAVRADAGVPWEIAARLLSFENLDEAVQVLLEDIIIAIVFVRLAAAIGGRAAVGVVAALFAAGHIPAMLSTGASPEELLLLLRDVALGVAVISVLRRSHDILWFWPIHFTLDMLQFGAITFGAAGSLAT